MLFSDDTGESGLIGSRAELSGLAEQLRAGEGTLRLSPVGDPTPYDVALERGVITRNGRPSVAVTLARESSALHFAGDQRSLDLVGDNLESFAASSEGADDHLHVEYRPGHFYLAPGSTSLVVRRAE